MCGVQGPDPDRDAVYDGERRLEQAVDVGALRAFGRSWQLEPEQRFRTLAAAQTFATLACLERGAAPVLVRHRAGDRKSHYSPADATIALASWGGTRLTLVHELAHHFVAEESRDQPSHGPAWRTRMLELLAHNGAPQQATFLRLAWAELELATPRPQG
ncbi:MAG: hypothetical protein GX596_09635 [Propionibacterium sp.]|nr:hypothetical protein [Propionibacterium sp.]